MADKTDQIRSEFTGSSKLGSEFYVEARPDPKGVFNWRTDSTYNVVTNVGVVRDAVLDGVLGDLVLKQCQLDEFEGRPATAYRAIVRLEPIEQPRKESRPGEDYS